MADRMHPDLEKLIDLQHAESQLRRAEGALAELPRRRQEMEAALAEERGKLDAFRESLDAAQKARRRLEGELQDLETKRSRYKGQLMDVKTNKEYTAMLHEIESVEREVRGREDLILAEMEKAETLTADVKREEQVFKGAEEQARSQGRQLDEEGRALQEQAARLAADRDRVAASLPEDLLALFQRVARRRGTGVAEARDENCTECHVRLRPQMYVELKRNDQIMQCPACSRILYFVPVAATAQP
jgi:predicted  nucleic acid-binding Zn-ribbon protein